MFHFQNINGKQPKRLEARIYSNTYTIIASLPLLILIISTNFNFSFSLREINVVLKFLIIIFKTYLRFQ